MTNKDKKYELIKSDKEGLYRVRALRDFSDVKKGDIGGYVQSEDNLSHDGGAWVCDNATVCGNAWVYDNATVCGNARVYGGAWVCDDACVCGNAWVYDNAWVSGDARVCGNARVCGDARVFDKAKVCGNARVCGNAEVTNNAEVCNIADYIVFKNWWSSGRYFTWTRSNNLWKAGYFFGTGEELIKKAYKDSEQSGREYERIVKYVEEIIKEAEK